MKNSCRARRYVVCSYYVMYHGLDKMEDEVVNAVEEVPEVDANNSRNCAAVDVGSLKRKSVSSSMTLYVRLKFMFPFLCCALDFDEAFIERESGKKMQHYF